MISNNEVTEDRGSFVGGHFGKGILSRSHLCFKIPSPKVATRRKGAQPAMRWVSVAFICRKGQDESTLDLTDCTDLSFLAERERSRYDLLNSEADSSTPVACSRADFSTQEDELSKSPKKHSKAGSGGLTSSDTTHTQIQALSWPTPTSPSTKCWSV